MINLQTSHSHLVKWFQISFPDLVTSMKATSHHWDATTLNPYHLESDIFTHTMMVFKVAELLSPENNMVKWSALLHDIGKPRSMERVEMSVDFTNLTDVEIFKKYKELVNPTDNLTMDELKEIVKNKYEKKKVRFIGHEGISAYMSVDILNKTDLSVDDKIHIFKLIALHGTLFHFIKSDGSIKKDILDVFKGNKRLLQDLVHQVRADSLGRFLDYEAEENHNPEFTKMLPLYFAETIAAIPDVDTTCDNSKPLLTVFVGPPCSEKTTERERLLKQKPDTVVISRDDLVESFGKTKGMNYSQAFRFLFENPDIEATEISQVLEELKTAALKQKKDVIIDMTSMSKKSRRKWINVFSNYRKECQIFIKSYDSLMECLEKRAKETGKHISEKVLLNMLKTFSLPLYSEGFDDIHYHWK